MVDRLQHGQEILVRPVEHRSAGLHVGRAMPSQADRDLAHHEFITNRLMQGHLEPGLESGAVHVDHDEWPHAVGAQPV